MTIRIGVTKVALLDLGFSKHSGDGYSPGVHEFYLEHPTEPALGVRQVLEALGQLDEEARIREEAGE